MLRESGYGQFFRYALVGLLSNLMLYLCYILLTSLKVDYRMSMTAIYVIGTLSTYFFNKKWTFQHSGKVKKTLIKYSVTYVIGYVFNFTLLWFSVEKLGVIHEISQAILIFLTALLIFILQKKWVFKA